MTAVKTDRETRTFFRHDVGSWFSFVAVAARVRGSGVRSLRVAAKSAD